MLPPQSDCRDICKVLVCLTHSRLLPKGLQLHAYVIKLGFEALPLVCHHLINFYSKTNLPHSSHKLFDSFPQKSATTWSSVISAFAQNDLPHLALRFFRRMLRHGLLPDDHTLPTATKSCAALSSLPTAHSLHALAIKSANHFDVFVGSSLVDMYAKCGEINNARKVFDEMPHKNVVSWSGLIYGYSQLGLDEEALNLFKCALQQDYDIRVNDFTLSSVLRVCSASTLFELGKQVHGLCFKTSFDSSCFVASSLISLYSKCGVVEGGYKVFEEVKVRNLGMWNAMLIACAQHAHTGKTFELFEEMGSVGVKPNFITFLCLLYACSHAGLVERGKHYFGLMKEHGIEPGSQHYATMVDLLGRAGKLDEAFRVIEGMPMEPTESVWGALLTGCRIHGNTEWASFVADRIFEMGAVSSGINVLLSNAYAAAGRWEEAARARKMLRDQGIKKETGLSWVEEGNRVHTFAAGDRSHGKTKEIYEKLEELGEKIAKAGYVADTSFVLKEVDGDEKSQTIRYHSERLAIAFGLITFPQERPIRVMKNLRVCGDCHTAIKFISKCTGRVIIVRDNNRFHRFEEGKCTCGDYW
ncbi:putative pentatricopeptide repeat-containing protein At5g52630 [Vigna umbellata]|uniref:putative pentatricopeptide repeat-containing protein At5g52630 n=1 Tax=Vigna umbellata TaxID=87088 RepID=UPI001F5EA439|nr:putative pentatricopeptide repeat-containing protein At5g52630 [Vigna umbellata]XP_047173745.1 putative pentatricopeptide repeat-containing protein At5g52630 [Vigna umbellata]